MDELTMQHVSLRFDKSEDYRVKGYQYYRPLREVSGLYCETGSFPQESRCRDSAFPTGTKNEIRSVV